MKQAWLGAAREAAPFRVAPDSAPLGTALTVTLLTLALLAALWTGERSFAYEGIARESDAPRRSYFIVVPYLSTLVGGLASNLFFGQVAVAGYLVTGIADAIAEPIGTRFGRHPYRVPSLGGISARRTWEGSAAVFAGSLLALYAAAQLLGTHIGLAGLVAVAAACTLVEAASPHGSDNATLQLAASGLVERRSTTFWRAAG